MSITCELPQESWHGSIQSNSKLLSGIGREEVQESLLTAVKRYHDELTGYVQQLNLEISIPRIPEKLPRYLVGTGHQSLIFHQGIARKYIEAEEIACTSDDYASFHLILDRDKEWAGNYRVPQGEGELLQIANRSVGSRSSPFAEFEKVSYEDEGLLSFLSFSEVEKKERITRAHEIYQACNGFPIGVAHSLVRIALSEPKNLFEVPLSYVLEGEPVQRNLYELADKGEELHLLYNNLLESYRAERKIKNLANPFPNLRADEEKYGKEMPFWVFEKEEGSRSEVSFLHGELVTVLPNGPVSLPDPERFLLMPRGALNSLFYRVYLFDFFIHGLGGGKYDRFTDRLISALYSIEAPSFAVVSETKYLFSEAERMRELEEKIASLRDLYTHPLTDTVKQLLTEKDFKALSTLVAERDQLVTKLSSLGKGEEKAATGKQLSQVNLSIRELLDESFGNAWRDELAKLEKSRQVYCSREYPFFAV